MNFSEQVNPSSKTTYSGSQHLKILESLRIILQYRQESSMNWMNWKTRKNSIHKRAQNLEKKFSNDLNGPIHFLQKWKKKQAIEDILVDYHDIFARHRMDIGMNTEFKVKLTPKDDTAVYSQSLPLPIHLKKDLIVELALMHKYGITTVPPFSKYASPYFRKGSPTGNCVSLWIYEKSTVWLQMTILTTIIQLALCQMQHNTWQGSHCSAN